MWAVLKELEKEEEIDKNTWNLLEKFIKKFNPWLLASFYFLHVIISDETKRGKCN